MERIVPRGAAAHRPGTEGPRLRSPGEGRPRVAPIRIDAGHCSPDTRAFFAALAGERVRYVVVGGEAVILHGHVRLTGDVDVFYSRDSEDLHLLFGALVALWDGDVPGIDAVSFDEAWAGHVEAVIVGEGSEIPVRFIGLDALDKSKRASGRPRDLDDTALWASQHNADEDPQHKHHEENAHALPAR